MDATTKIRLIDANALKDEMCAGCVPIDLGGIAGILGDDDSIGDYIDNAQTIDAIPVDWLESMLDKTAVENVELNNAIFYVLCAWEREKGREHETG